MKIADDLTLNDLEAPLRHVFNLAADKVKAIDGSWDPGRGTPVFTDDGTYTTRGWTEWTQGFQYGCALLAFEGTGDESLLEIGRRGTLERMAPHVSHIGVHDHGFNNVSTYGNLRRMMLEGLIPTDDWAIHFFEMALKVSGAVQAARWTRTREGGGFIHSFNGPHSLFSDTIRSCRALAVAHQLGHPLMGENDEAISLLERLVQHAQSTARHNVYYGEGRDVYDVAGRVVHESIFNVNDGRYRCPSTQQGYSAFSTWTRGLAWVVTGYPELLEYAAALPEDAFDGLGGRETIVEEMVRAARVTADFFIDGATAADGIPYWDTGAPGLARMEGHLEAPANPYNDHEPVDSSASAIAAQGLYRLGSYLGEESGRRYRQAALTTAATLFKEPYLSTSSSHQGLILHSIYHRPNGWDTVHDGQKVPNGESSMWGDYHALELALLLERERKGQPYLTFFDA